MEHVMPISLERPYFDRIRAHTMTAVNDRIDEQIRKNVAQYSHSPEMIRERLRVLDEEWDIDRALMAQFSVIAFTSLVAGISKNRSWLWLPALQLPFLFLHSARGWCPPMPILRRLGFRSRQEIDMEKHELRKAGAARYQTNPPYFPGQ